MTNAFILCDLLWKVQKSHTANIEESFKYAYGKIRNGVPNNINNALSVEAFQYTYKKLTKGSTIIYERFCIILMCMIYFS